MPVRGKRALSGIRTMFSPKTDPLARPFRPHPALSFPDGIPPSGYPRSSLKDILGYRVRFRRLVSPKLFARASGGTTRAVSRQYNAAVIRGIQQKHVRAYGLLRRVARGHPFYGNQYVRVGLSSIGRRIRSGLRKNVNLRSFRFHGNKN